MSLTSKSERIRASSMYASFGARPAMLPTKAREKPDQRTTCTRPNTLTWSPVIDAASGNRQNLFVQTRVTAQYGAAARAKSSRSDANADSVSRR
jgi:hypothetical protein